MQKLKGRFQWSFRVSKWANKGGDKAIHWAKDFDPKEYETTTKGRLYKIFFGQNHSLNLTAKVLIDYNATSVVKVVMNKRELDFSKVDPKDSAGAVTPGATTQAAIIVLCRGQLAYLDHLSRLMRDNDGAKNSLTYEDFAIVHGASVMLNKQMTIRTVRNLTNSIPIMQQQAALNYALMEYMQRYPKDRVAVIANQMGVTVGSRWDRLNSIVPTGPGRNSVFAGTGLYHLFSDVPEGVIEAIKSELQGKELNEETVRAAVWLAMCGAVLAEQAAVGALKGTQKFMTGMEDVMGHLLRTGELFAAKKFFAEQPLWGAVSHRDEKIILIILAHYGKYFPGGRLELQLLFNDARFATRAKGENVRQIAHETSWPIANGNLENALNRIQ